MDIPEHAPGHCPLAKNTDICQCLLPFIPIHKGGRKYILKLFGARQSTDISVRLHRAYGKNKCSKGPLKWGRKR